MTLAHDLPPDDWTSDSASTLREYEAATRAHAESARRYQHARGKRSAFDRIDELLDPGSFVEVGGLVRHRSTGLGLDAQRPLGDAVVTGHGTVDGRPVCVFAQDFSIFGGSLGEVAGEKIVKIMDLAMETRAPMIGINDSAGGRIQEGVVAQSLYGEIFTRNVRMSGAVPQISLIMGPSAGGAVYSPALTDFVVMVDGSSQMFVTGPAVLREASGQDVTAEELGGAWMHNTRSGAAHHVAETESAAFAYVRELLSHLPGTEPAPVVTALAEVSGRHALNTVIPGPDEPYDVRSILDQVLDHGPLLEVQRWYAPNVVTGFGRLKGRSVGVVANQPADAGGRLDVAASLKAARFVRTCDAFGLPVVTFVDTADFSASLTDEHDGAVRRFAALLHAYAEATVPLLTVITRRADGIAYVALGSRHLGADLCLAWPTARIDGHEPYAAAERGYVDDVIEPADTRDRLLRALRLLQTKTPVASQRKHDNLPL